MPPAAPVGQHIDRKRWRKLQKKRIAMGHKPDDHEEIPRQDMGDMTMGWYTAVGIAVKNSVEFYSRSGYTKGKKGAEYHAEHQTHL